MSITIENKTSHNIKIRIGENQPGNILLPQNEDVIKSGMTGVVLVETTGCAKMFVWTDGGVKLWSGVIPIVPDKSKFAISNLTSSEVKVVYNDQVIPSDSRQARKSMAPTVTYGSDIRRNLTGKMSRVWYVIMAAIILVLLYILVRRCRK